MDIARSSIERPLKTWIIVAVCLLGGLWGQHTIGQLEDPAFTIKSAIVVTAYPGASAQEVADSVASVIENELNGAKGLLYYESVSDSYGSAEITATFKPGTDDMREAPSLTIVPALVGSGARVRVVDPQGRREGEALLPGVSWMEDPYAAADGADLVVILTEWNEFRALDLTRLGQNMARRRMADLRNIYARGDVLAAGFESYEAVGR